MDSQRSRIELFADFLSVRTRMLALAPLVMLVTGCVEFPTIPEFEPNVIAFGSASVTQTDEALLVAGGPRIDFGNGIRSIYFSHQQRYVYRDVFSSVDNDREMDDQWYMDFRRSRTLEQRADTLFRKALDFGDVTIDGTLASRLVNPNQIVVPRGDSIWVLDGYLTYRASFYGHRSILNGGDVSFSHEPAYDNIMAGRPVTVSVSGSSEVDPASASFRVRPGVRLVDMWNGETVAYQSSMPHIRTDRPLMLEFDRALEHDRALIRIHYIPPEGTTIPEEERRAASGAFMLMGPSRRIVIPPGALGDIASRLPEPVAQMLIDVREYLVDEDVMNVRYSDGEEESYSVLRTASLRVYATMSR